MQQKQQQQPGLCRPGSLKIQSVVSHDAIQNPIIFDPNQSPIARKLQAPTQQQPPGLCKPGSLKIYSGISHDGIQNPMISDQSPIASGGISSMILTARSEVSEYDKYQRESQLQPDCSGLSSGPGNRKLISSWRQEVDSIIQLSRQQSMAECHSPNI